MAKSRARKLADIIVGAGVDINGNLTFDGGSTSEDLTFADGDKANFGDASDLQIFHDGNNSRITDSGTGALILRGANSVEIESTSGEDMAVFRNNAQAELYYDASKKLETTSTGTTITGNMSLNATDGFAYLSNIGVGNAGIYVRGIGGSNILRSHSTGQFTWEVSGSEKMRLTSGGNLGIGTTSPTEPLTVSETSSGNTMQVASFVNPVGTANTGVRLWLSGTNTTTRGTFIDAVAESTANDHSLRFGTSTNASAPTERMRIDKSGNVGIGTTSPNSYSNFTTLTLNGTNGGLLDFETNGTFVGEVFADSASGLALQSIGSRYIRFLTNGGERMRIGADGDVGIGTTSPQTRFHVESSDGSGIRVSRSGASAYLQLFPAYSNVPTIMGLGAGGLHLGYNSNTAGIRIDTNNNIGIGTTAPANTLHVKAGASGASSFDSRYNLVLEDDGENYIGLYAPNNSFAGIRFVNASSSLRGYIDYYHGSQGDKMHLYAQNSIQFDFPTTGTAAIIKQDGKVGIGSTSPLFKLHVDSSTTNTVAYFKSSNNKAAILIADNDTNTFVSAENSVSSFGSNAGINANNLNVTSAGRVGIGVTSPSAIVEIKDAAAAAPGTALKVHSVQNSAAADGLVFIHSEQSLAPFTALNVRQDGNGDILNLLDGTTEVFTVVNGGNVGIGTTSPTSILHVVGSSAKTRIQDSSNNYALDLQMSSSIGKISTSADMALRPGGVESVRLKSDGKVGIGTTAPANQFVIKSGTNVDMEFGSEASGGFIQTYNRSTSAYGYLRFITNGETMRLTNTGNVGIGDSNPDSKLVVNGGRASEGVTAGGTYTELTRTSGGDLGLLFNKDTSKWLIGIDNSDGNAGPLRFMYGAYNASVHPGFGTDYSGLNLAYNGYVGIGTKAPSTPLQIVYNGGHTSGTVGLANSAFDIYNNLEANTDEKGSILTFSDNYYSSGGNSYHRTTRAAIKGGTDTAGNTADGFLAFYTDSGAANTMPERMRINHDGSTIINSTSPFLIGGTARLSIYDSSVILSGGLSGSDMFYIRKQGTAAFAWQTYNGNNGGQIELQPYGGSVGIGTTSPTGAKLHVAGGIKGTDLIAHDSTGINLQTDEGTKRLVVTDAGNIGIGTTSPQALLHLNSGTDTYFILGTTNSTADGRIQFRNSAGTDAGGLWYNTSGNKMMFRTNSTERMHINSGGQIGIGTTSVDTNAGVEIATVAPNTGVTTLRITNAVNNKGQRIDFEDDNAVRCFTLSHDNGSNITYMGNLANESFAFYTNSAERMRITADGYLLVGKTNTTFSNSGIELRSGNLGARFIRSNAEPIIANRTGNDGKVIAVYGQGTEVGSLFVNAGSLVVKGASTSAPVQLQTHDGNEDIEVDPDGFIKFETAGSEQMRITDTGAIHCREKSSNGDYTMYIGSVNPGGSGARYAHVQINTDGGEMFWVEAIGYDYISGESIYGRGGGYVYNYANQTGVYANGKHGDIVELYQNTSGRVEIVIDLTATQTNNRWGSVVLRGGCDTITTSAALEIIQYSYTSTTAKVY